MPRQILVWEYLSGGGLANDFLSASLLCEGVAMLCAIARDFAKAGFELAIPLDERLIALKEWLPPSRIIVISKKDDLREILKQEATRVGAFFIIAPEFDSLLFSYTRLLETVSHNWGCSSSFIKIFGNKWETWKYWKTRGIVTPRTWELLPTTTSAELVKIIQACDDKIILKPASGAGSEKIFSCSFADMQKPSYASAVMQKISNGGYLAQEFIPGVAGSANFIVVQKIIKAVCANDQIIELGTSPDGLSRYIGGISPARSILKHITLTSLQNALQPLIDSFPSLECGLFGVDFICDFKGVIHFIEVNSRLTTSYVSLSEVLSQNPISLMINGKSPSLVDILSKSNLIAYYRKLTLFENKFSSLLKGKAIKVQKMPTLSRANLACPPLQDSYGNMACFLIITGATCETIAQKFSAAKQYLSRHLD